MMENLVNRVKTNVPNVKVRLIIVSYAKILKDNILDVNVNLTTWM